MRDLELYFLLLSIFVLAISGQAPGDEVEFCLTLPTRPSFADQIVLMSSRNYERLIESEGPWIVVDRDNNNDGTSTTVSDEMLWSFYVYFYFSGRSQEQLVTGLLVCADSNQAHRITG